MLPQQTTIASAAEVAARLPGTRRDGQAYRTRGYCHGSEDKPDSASLKFSDPDKPGYSLDVHCFNCSPSTPAEYDAIRHALQKATNGLHLCRCRICWEAQRRGVPPQQRRNSLRPQTPPPAPKETREQTDTSERAAKYWRQAHPSTGSAPKHHPVSQWLIRHPVWPAGRPLPPAVRWLPRSLMPQGRPGSTAAGALVMAMWPLDQVNAPEVRKVQLVAIDATGSKAHHWGDEKGDKRTYGRGPAKGLLFHEPPDGQHAYELHAVEGLKDGLNLLQALPTDAGQIVAVCAGTAYASIEPLWFKRITLWPDADPAGITAAQKTARQWVEQHGPSIEIQIKQLQPGQDPGAIQWRSPDEN